MNEEHNSQNQNPGKKGVNEEGQKRERKPKYVYLHEYLGNVSQIPNRLPPDLGKYRSGDANYFENAAKRPSDFQRNSGHFYADMEIANSYTKRKNILTESEEANARLLTSRDHLYGSDEGSTDARNMSPKYETYHTSTTYKYDTQSRQQYLNLFNDWSLTLGSPGLKDFNFNETVPHLSTDDLLKMLTKLAQLKLNIAQERVQCKSSFPARYKLLKMQEDRLSEGYDIVRQELENRD